jgi:WD40 repeat protein
MTIAEKPYEHFASISLADHPSAPSQLNESPDGGAIANILHASSSFSRDRIYISSADRRWTELSASPPYNVVTSSQPNDNPILSSVPLPGHTALTTMSGQLLLLNNATGKVVSVRRDHTKYAVQVAAAKLSTSTWALATASWDGTVKLYRVGISSDNEGINSVILDADLPIPTMKFQTNPESILFVRHPDTEDLYLIASRRDSTHLYYYKLTISPDNHLQIEEAGRQNLAPHSNAWVSYTPSMLALHPSDPSLLAIATSHLPHMKLIIVRLLFPGLELAAAPGGTQASQARTALATQDKEDAAIRLQVSTLAPQTPYSTPVVVWRPDGSGVWVNGDDGAVRGIEVRTGKVVAVLKGHEAGTKVRTLWAGEVVGIEDEGGVREVLVSGGFDKRVFVWTVDPDGGETAST